MSEDAMSPRPAPAADTRRSNLRLAWILASVALVFFVGFVAKIALFGPH